MQIILPILVAGMFLIIHVVNTFLVRPLQTFLKSRRLGCGPVPFEPTRWPLGIDTVRRSLQADKEQRTPDFIASRFETMGRYTWGLSLLGTSNLITADPRNVQALLATQFDDFVMGTARRTNLKTALGRSIFAVDGKAWHRARETMRPIFSRENVSRLELLEEHVQTMLRIIETKNEGLTTDAEDRAWSAPVSLAVLLPRLTMDSATELFLGQSTHSLNTALVKQQQNSINDEHDEYSFDHAFERMLAILGTRMRLRSLYWLYGNKELEKCINTLHTFVDSAIDAADQARKSGSSQLRYDFLESLRTRCSDRAEVREQVLGLLAAGRDTTASLTAWVFYCLVRSPRVYKKLRETVLAEFGPYSTKVGQTITFEKLKGCTYLQHVLNETLRLHSVVPFNSRCAARDTTLPVGGGPDGSMPVFVPKGTEVNFSTHVLHRRKDLWGEDADDFVPERWEKRRPGLIWQYVPFNGGPRICIGQQFALTEAGYVLVRMLQRYDIIEGLDVDVKRDWHNFTVVCSPGSPVARDAAVMCRLRPILYFLVRSIYYLFFHPLSAFPGPKLWAVSRVPWNYVNLQGDLAWRIRDMHLYYNSSVIRIAPDELSYTSSTALKKIDGTPPPREFLKCLDGRGIAPAVVNGRRSIVTETPERHTILRRALQPAFSERALRDQEDFFRDHTDRLIAQLRKPQYGITEQNILRWFALLSFDIMSDLAFGQPAGCLDRVDEPWLEVIGSRVKSIVWYQFAVYYHMEWILRWIMPKAAMEARKRHQTLTLQKVQRRIEEERSGKRKGKRRDFMSYILGNDRENLSNMDLFGMASALIVAGSNTTTYTMTAFVFFVCRHPEVYARVVAEVRGKFASETDVTMVATACIEETMRMSPPTPSALPRWVPEGGEEIDGKWVPGGTAVGVHNLAACHVPWNWHRPLEFIPERWLQTKEGEFTHDDRGASRPFSYGRHDCIGQTMAMNEMRLALAKLFWNFDISLYRSSEDWWITQKSYLVWEKKPLMVSIKPRH
ncbi:unnamed protein product [Alternaria alternata]